MDQWNSRDEAHGRSFFGKAGVFSLLLVIGFMLYFFFG